MQGDASVAARGIVREGSLEEGVEAGLSEMPIAGERVGDAFALHHNERDAVGERPILVGTGLVEGEGGFEEGRVNSDDRHPRRGE